MSRYPTPPLPLPMTMHRAFYPDDGRMPAAGWITYPGDARSILEPSSNPEPTGVGLHGCARGPNRLGELLWPVVAEYDDKARRTRVGFSLVRPDHLDEDTLPVSQAVTP